MDRVVLADAGPLIHLAQIQDGLAWLERMFRRVAITPAVRSEVLPGRNAPGEEEIVEALRLGVLHEIRGTSSSVRLPRLGGGEASTILAALSLVDEGNSCLLIMDDRRGRKVVKELGSASIAVAGTVAIVGLAKEMGLIDSAARVFTELRKNGLYASRELLEVLLERVGEASEIESGKQVRAGKPNRSRKLR